MLNVPNALSLLRIPLVLVFLQNNTTLRIIGIILAMCSDILDGYLARRYKLTSQFGAVLDPLMDKFFVMCTLVILQGEGRIGIPEMMAMLCRDFAVMCFGLYLMIRGKWTTYKFQSIWCGKITTSLQLFVLIWLVLGFQLPSYLFISFIVLGILALLELYLGRPKTIKA